MANFDPVYEAMIGLDNSLRLRDPMPIPIERLTLSSTHGFILSRLDNHTNVAKLLSLLPNEEEEAAASKGRELLEKKRSAESRQEALKLLETAAGHLGMTTDDLGESDTHV